ncbi:hypothetical protein G9F71_008515 [Clostridium sp. FP2]|uniref:hypothetical protein n=1 Tax=Clostridium sp. FP2 TaxID=2724481 RepID=UPI0013E977CB|nr:hypothetical protein [Clostridium sp. FP2]MBZ9622895.1 hypothetical protein [Clostridium sp. FP2]
MENHPIMFFFLIVIWGLYAVYYAIKTVVVLLIGLYKWSVKKIKERKVNSNVVDR